MIVDHQPRSSRGDETDQPPERTSLPKSFVRHCILLLLSEERSHGYSLLSQLKMFGFGRSDRVSVYHLLRKLELDGLVESVWDLPDGAGPARKVYDLTPAGRARLHESADDVEECSRLFEAFTKRYEGGSRDE